MPIPSPFHPLTSAVARSHEWRDWSGRLAASLYEPSHEHEYYAIRSAAALIDVSPLFKYELSGPQALQAANRIFTRDLTRVAVGQIAYTPWCDDDGKVIDDGTVWRQAAQRFGITSADPNLAWFQDCCYGLDVRVVDKSDELAALALQGPLSRAILERLLQGIDLAALKYYHFAVAQCPAAGGAFPVTVSRTGYTGDLGYELWVEPQDALALYQALLDAGQDFGLAPAGMLALDIARIEAGLVMIGVDYQSARHALIPGQKSSPFEIGLGKAVDFRKPAFVGRRALWEEQQRGPEWTLLGVEVDWPSLEAAFGRWRLSPSLAGRASRSAVPLYEHKGEYSSSSIPEPKRGEPAPYPSRGREGKQVGYAVSHTFSPLLKRYIGLATVAADYARIGRAVQVEVTIEHTRQAVDARLVSLPFFNPARKRA